MDPPSGEKRTFWTRPPALTKRDHVGRAERAPGGGVVDGDGAALVAGGHQPPVRAESRPVHRPAVVDDATAAGARRAPTAGCSEWRENRRARPPRGSTGAPRRGAPVPSASTPSRWASAVRAASRASPRWLSATIARHEGEARAGRPRPASTARRRRFARRWCSASCFGLGTALVEEGAFELVEVALVACGPVERRGEPRAAVELAGVAAAGLPLARRVDQVLVEAPALGVLLEPAAQARPFAQQRLVRDLERPLDPRSRAGCP